MIIATGGQKGKLAGWQLYDARSTESFGAGSVRRSSGSTLVDRLSNFVEMVKPRRASIFSLLVESFVVPLFGNRLGRLAYMEKLRGVSLARAIALLEFI